MGITSFYFLCFFTVLLVVYYCIPRKFQWGFLLMGSVAYCLLAGQGRCSSTRLCRWVPAMRGQECFPGRLRRRIRGAGAFL